ncbi:hypothetical protein SEMRO_2041_G312261.1 [Seminavis robusta]|uniref:Uncharacterized protein n=1 Tax=Seminavis robusta TaxID=568900 RepID=A0A9N8HVS8_9STRA|nr:hypothetical protein SEMRO_2041_G312261.1 [Seminavis robusta]|eukprot:Sro2041_g312261.1  (111) ;mRNA; r:14571-14903
MKSSPGFGTEFMLLRTLAAQPSEKVVPTSLGSADSEVFWRRDTSTYSTCAAASVAKCTTMKRWTRQQLSSAREAKGGCKQESWLNHVQRCWTRPLTFSRTEILLIALLFR